jgi:curved DNA-binding protein CbpA
MARTFYEILQVLPDASPEVIRAAYRSLSAKYHPDKDGSKEAAKSFAQIQMAFETLSDADRKAEYDKQLEAIPPIPWPVVPEELTNVSGHVSHKKEWPWGQLLFAVAIAILGLTVATKQFGMTGYGNRESGIAKYTYGADWIRVQFNDGDTYEYRASKIGQLHINEMKRLADAGDGLSTYINTHRDVYYGSSSHYGENGKAPKRSNVARRFVQSPSSTRSQTTADEKVGLSTSIPRTPLTGLWRTSNGDTLKLTESGNSVNIDLLRSSVMARGTGVLTRTGNSLNGTLTGAFYSDPTLSLKSEFVGTVKNRDHIEYTVDVVRFIGKTSLTQREKARFTMSRLPQ